MSDPFDEMAEAIGVPMTDDGFYEVPDFQGMPVVVEEEIEESLPTESPSIDPLAELVFDGRHREDFEGLMFLGDLRTSFDCLGHEIVIKTLTVDELLKVGLMTKEWEGTLSADRAYITAIVAACIDTVDGIPLVNPMGPGTDLVRAKFKYVRENWYFWTTDLIYQEFRALELRVQKLIDAMGEASS